MLAYVKNAKPKVSVYTYEDTYYDLYPSDETIDAATEALSKYAASHNTPANLPRVRRKLAICTSQCLSAHRFRRFQPA